MGVLSDAVQTVWLASRQPQDDHQIGLGVLDSFAHVGSTSVCQPHPQYRPMGGSVQLSRSTHGLLRYRRRTSNPFSGALSRWWHLYQSSYVAGFSWKMITSDLPPSRAVCVLRPLGL